MMTLIRKALAIGALVFLGPMLMAAEPPPLETVVAIRTRLARTWSTAPVRLQGQVTFCVAAKGLAFVQDETAGVAFYPRGIAGARQPKFEDTVEITGVPQMREGMLMIMGEGSSKNVALPPAITWPDQSLKIKPRPFNLAAAGEMRVNAELIRANGIVRRLSPLPGGGMLAEMTSPAGRTLAHLPWTEPLENQRQWLNQSADLNGVVVAHADKQLLPDDVDAVIFVPNSGQWQSRPGVMTLVFASPPVTAAQIRHDQPLHNPGRQRVDGTVTALRLPSTLCLRTPDGSMEVSTSQVRQFRVGDKIAVAARALSKHGEFILADGVCRLMDGKAAAAPTPVLIASAQEAERAGHGELVRFVGLVRDNYRYADRGRLLVALEKGGTCSVRWEPPVNPGALSGAALGAQFEFTGICETAKPGHTIEDGTSFTLRPRSNSDLKLVSGAPWWTPRRMARALWILLFFAITAVPGLIFLRWKLWCQQEKIREIERAAASADERQRIAREFHDSLQQELFSASLHVETLREAYNSAPHLLPAMLEETAAMLRHCQVEARNCIWDLRADDEFREGLGLSLQSWLKMRQRLVPDTALHFETQGEEPRLTPDTCLQVLRIAQEAVNNALAHARASRVQVRVKGGAEGLEVLVEDDGAGFNTAAAPAAANGHYGLSMLQERARRIHARVDLRSEKDRGTWVRLVVPHPSRLS